ncbi:MAG: polyprenyl synthetase family protein [Candidatus Eisenbacteria bacterium]
MMEGQAPSAARVQGAPIQEARAYLEASAERANRVLGEFWEQKRRDWNGFPEIIHGAFEAYDQMTCSGKKIRAGLVVLGHDICRHAGTVASPRVDGIYRAAGAVEILHNAFLIHDDIVDRSDVRRSVATVHRRYADAHRADFPREEEALAYGRAVALNFGDKGQALAQELLLSSSFGGEVLLAAIGLLSRITADTVAGQLLDVAHVPLPALTEEHVLQIHEYKTAHYTVMLPLQMGAVLAAAPPATLPAIHSYAIPVGIAFQVQDDILGLFGEERVLGKPVDSDVREGKKTLLIVHAYQEASPAERRFLERTHGNENIGRGELEEVRRIVRETGALERSEALARQLVGRGKVHIPAIAHEERWRGILTGLADYLIQRRH